jgi:flagellar protein FlaG
MANQEIKQIANVTGTFPALQFNADVVSSSGKAAPETGKEQPVEAKNSPDLEALAAKLNVATQSIGRDLRFKVDMDSGQSVIQVLDRDTGELIREIPPEKVQFSVSSNGDVQLRLYDALA